METSRRGFIGLLSGLLVAGKVIGPRVIEAPTPEIWKAAPRLPLDPVTNQYVSLNTLTSDVLVELRRRLEWMRLRHDCEQRSRFGDMVMVREPIVFRPDPAHMDWRPGFGALEKVAPARIVEHVAGDIQIDDRDFFRRPYRDIHDAYIEPMARAMADRVRTRLEAHNGARAMIAVPPADLGHLGYQTTLVTNEELGLIVRGIYARPTPMDELGRGCCGTIRLDMYFGFAG